MLVRVIKLVLCYDQSLLWSRFSKISAGSLTSWLLIFLLHFFMFLVFLTTSNLPALTSFNSFCFLRSFLASLISFLLAIFFSLNSRTWFLSYFSSSALFFFSSQVILGPLLTVLFVGLRLTPSFQVRLLLFMPTVNFLSWDLMS